MQSKNYDDVSSNCSKIACANEGIGHFAYPKILKEDMYYEAIPCVTFKYLHILTASYHYISVLAIDNEMDIYFHSNPTYAPETQTFSEKYSEWFKKAFSTLYTLAIQGNNIRINCKNYTNYENKVNTTDKVIYSGTFTTRLSSAPRMWNSSTKLGDDDILYLELLGTSDNNDLSSLSLSLPWNVHQPLFQ